ncbi:MAG: glycosyltransferase [Chitinophagaceae bacterium]|nr:glycosyltransferase [Chitinophagaceae bacterium]
MKILYLAPSIGLTLEQSGGAGTHMRGTIQGFRDNGVEILPVIGGDVVEKKNGMPTPTTSQPVKASTQQTGIKKIIKSLMPDKFRLFLRDMRTFYEDRKIEKLSYQSILEFSPDVIYERSGYLSTYGTRLAKKLRIPHLLETDGCMIEVISKDYGVFSERFGNWLEKRKLQKADYAVVMNAMAVNPVSQKFNLPSDKFIVKTLGVSDQSYTVNKDTVEELKLKYSLHGKLVIGFVGAISLYHGVQYLVEAARILQEQNQPDIVIVIVGWSKEAEQLQARANELGLTNLVFTGKVDKKEVGNYFSLFDAGVIPDAEENIYPVKVLEYGLFGLCPIVPGYEVFDEILQEGQTGYTFKPGNPESLAAKITSLVNQRNEVQHCASNWEAFVKKHFQWKDTVKNIISTLNSPR